MKILIDTGAWVALNSSKDIHHAQALQFRDQIARERCQLYTSNYILDETYTLLLLDAGYQRTVTLMDQVQRLQQSHVLSLIRVSEELESRAEAVFRRFNQDKFWSFTDCTSKVIMDSLGIKGAFAFDRHFDQMGFTRRP